MTKAQQQQLRHYQIWCFLFYVMIIVMEFGMVALDTKYNEAVAKLALPNVIEEHCQAALQQCNSEHERKGCHVR